MKHLVWLFALLLTACTPSALIVMPDFATLTPQAIPTAGATSTPIPTDIPEPIVEVDAEGEYYRGVYDVCGWLVKQTGRYVDCLAFVERARASSWYEQDSVGWVWPFEVSY